MEKKTTMGYVPLNEYVEGKVAVARLEALKDFTIKCNYSILREEVASFLGFELPAETCEGSECEPARNPETIF